MELEITTAVVSHLDLRDFLKSISASVRRIIPHDAAFLTLIDEAEKSRLRVHALDLQKFDLANVVACLTPLPKSRRVRAEGWKPVLHLP